MTLSPPVVIRSPNWLGDAVLTLPAIANLKKLLGASPLTVASPASLSALWETCPLVDQVLTLNQPKKIWQTSQQLAAHPFQTMVLLPNSLRAALEAKLARIPTIIGYGGRGRDWLGIKTVPRRKVSFSTRHQKYDWLHLAEACGASSQEPPIRWSVQFDPQTPPGQSPIIFCPGAEYGPAKRWPEDNYVILAQQLISKYSLPLIFMGTKKDAPLGAHLARRVPGSLNLCGKTTLREFILRLAQARLVVSNDSGGMHLAAILGVPTVSIFGSTEPRMTGPLGHSVRVLRHHVPCSPCFLRHCPLDFSCMKSISPTQVLALCEELLVTV